MDGKLDVGTAGFDTDFADDVDRCIPHGLIFSIRERLGGRHGDAVARMNTHGVEVLNGANNDHVILEIPHHLQLIFLPAQQGFFHDDFADHTGFKPCAGKSFHLLPVVSHATAHTAQGEARPDYEGVPDLLSHLSCLRHVPCNAASRDAQANSRHGVSELLPILRLANHREGGTDHLRAYLLQQAGFGHLDRGVETGLPSQSRKHGLGSFPLDHLGQDLC